MVRPYNETYLWIVFIWIHDINLFPLRFDCGKNLSNTAFITKDLNKQFPTNETNIEHKKFRYLKNVLKIQNK